MSYEERERIEPDPVADRLIESFRKGKTVRLAPPPPPHRDYPTYWLNKPANPGAQEPVGETQDPRYTSQAQAIQALMLLVVVLALAIGWAWLTS